MQLMSLVYVMTGGAVGAALRHLVMVFAVRFNSDFPYGTLFVNIFGSFLMGVWIAVIANWLPERSRDLHLLLAVGVLGGFTTFSTFSLDVFYLFERGYYLQAGGYVVGSVVLSVLALVGGMLIVKIIT